MKALLRREFQKNRHMLLWQALLLLGLPWFLLLCFQINRYAFFSAGERLLRAAPEVYALLGIPEGTDAGRFLFYELFPTLFLNVWVVFWLCLEAADILGREERSGSAYFIVNQWYNRARFCTAKYLWLLLRTASTYLVWFVNLFLVCCIGAATAKQRAEAAGAVFGSLLLDIPAAVLLVSLCFYFSIRRDRPAKQSAADILLPVLAGTFLLGNLPKLFDLLQKQGQGATPVRFLSILSPLSWMNPLVSHGAAFRILIPLISVGAAVLLFGFSVKEYQKRTL